VKAKRQKNIPWFNDDFGGEFVFDDVVEALSIYKKVYKDFSNLTDNSFVVPTQSDEYAEIDSYGDDGDDDDTSSMVAPMMRGGTNELDDLLNEIEGLETETGEVATRQAETAPEAKISPADWPEHLGGMVLGNIVQRIRDGSLEVKHLPERKAELDKLDFDWGPPKHFIDVPFEKAMCAMYAYYLIRGDLFTPREFIMPDEDPWPQALAGFEVGEAVHRLRELQNFMEAFHPEKVSLLRMIDFAWFPTQALPIDPNEPETTPEMERLTAFGHPDYMELPPNIPMGLPEKIMNEGPVFESDDPKLWWRKYHNWDYVKDIWYELGRRDNAYVLRKKGYPQLADEHEAKYGPGILTVLNETLQELEVSGLKGKSQDELLVLQGKLEFLREELTDCTDIGPTRRGDYLDTLDSYLFAMSTGQDPVFRRRSEDGEDADIEYEDVDDEDTPEEDDLEDEVEEDEVEEDEVEEDEVDDGEVDDDDEEEALSDDDDEEEEDFDVDDELGLGDEEDGKKSRR